MLSADLRGAIPSSITLDQLPAGGYEVVMEVDGRHVRTLFPDLRLARAEMNRMARRQHLVIVCSACLRAGCLACAHGRCGEKGVEVTRTRYELGILGREEASHWSTADQARRWREREELEETRGRC